MQTHLFRYRWAGREYTVDIPAATEAEAKARVAAISATAVYDGVLVARIPAAPGAGLLVRAMTSLRNAFAR